MGSWCVCVCVPNTTGNAADKHVKAFTKAYSDLDTFGGHRRRPMCDPREETVYDYDNMMELWGTHGARITHGETVT